MVIDEPALPATAAQTSADHPWPVRLLSESLKHYIDRAPATWVEGQLIEHRVVRGNAWMTLRDMEAEISLPVTAWRNVASHLDPGVQQGARVVAWVKPNFYTKTGRLSMIAQDIRPVGIGDLLARVERLRHALAEEGLFAQKKPLPLVPARIGLITGKDSDAMKDVMRNTLLRWPATEFTVVHTAVQGAQAPTEIIEALHQLDADERVDLIVIARGGGALEEVILPFSDERLVRTVAAATTPVVSAIGHEADHPVLDDVADLRASTPTDAAKRIVPDATVEAESIAQARLRMAAAVQRLVTEQATHLATVRSRPVLLHPETMITTRHEELTGVLTRARTAVRQLISREREVVEQVMARVRSLSPQSTLNRGYAVVQAEQGLIRRADQLQVGTPVNILLSRGDFHAEVTSINPSTDDEG
ncbi:exodeoxyribonuclease VII large subunit [Auritidibacter ignavus]|uniref:Exodeoxyribonuclease 7 large subunit n=1 Tax=Auritidibacter ignavus TaxID=678932 RepID=A0AAJ6AI90_9MICC|nr:exodeoxyribonuclease VII large subunit [Auritidibacter ignavus]WGH93202.1 exodeoxyribonuclease VII large subunit [Auritidibacter ignavus]